MRFQFADGMTQRLKTPVYFYASSKIGPYIPPDRPQAGRNDETFFQFAHDSGISVGAQKTDREPYPLTARNAAHQTEQVIGVARGRRLRFLVSNLKIDQSGASRYLVVDHIRHRGVAMRPATAEFLSFEMMRPPIFATGCFQHLWRERSPVHVLPQVVAR